jgi:hypothetical protein
MITASIYILSDGLYKRIELFNDEKISVTSSIQNVNDISKVFTDYSQSFTVPATKHNNEIFKHWYENAIDGGFDARTRKSAYIEINSASFRVGKIQLEKAQFKNNEIDNYQITFFGSLLSLKDLFGGKFLRDFDYSAYNFAYTGTVVKNRVSGGVTNDVKFPLITSYNNWTWGTNSHVKANYDISHQNSPIYHTDLFPAMRVSKIIETIASDLGITIQGNPTDNFLATDKYKNAFLWLKNTDTFTLKQTHQKINFQTNTSTVGTQGIFNVFTDSLTYVKPDAPVYLSKSNIKLTFTTSGTEFYFYVYKNGVKLSEQSYLTQTSQMTLSAPLEDSGTYTFYISSASAVTYTSVYEFETRNATTTAVVSDVTCTGTSQTTTTTLNIADYMPDMKAEDFFSGILKMFNLTCYSTSDGVFQIEQIENWYAGGTIRDISKYVISEQIDIERVKPYKAINFMYEKCENIIATEFLSRSAVPYGDLKYTLDNDGEEFEVSLPFENMPFQKFTNTNLQVGYSLKFDLNSYIPKPVILYDYNSIQTLSGGQHFHFNDGTSTNTVTTYNLFGQDTLISGQVNTINFGAQQSTFTDAIETRSLFNNYYLNYLTNIFTDKARILKLKAMFPISLINALKLNDRLIIRDKRYIINSFTTDLTTGEVDLELLNDFRVASAIPDPTTYYSFLVTNGSSATSGDACALTTYSLTIYGTNPTFEDNTTFYTNTGALFNGGSYYFKTALNKYAQINSVGVVLSTGSCGSAPAPTLNAFSVTNANSATSTEACPITDYTLTLYGELTPLYTNVVVYGNNTGTLVPYAGNNYVYHCNDGTWVQISSSGIITTWGTCSVIPPAVETFTFYTLK